MSASARACFRGVYSTVLMKVVVTRGGGYFAHQRQESLDLGTVQMRKLQYAEQFDDY